MLVTEGGVEVDVPEARDGASEGVGWGAAWAGFTRETAKAVAWRFSRVWWVGASWGRGWSGAAMWG